MRNAPVVFRCDGDARTGAGHVGRCLRLAAAFADAGHDVLLVGRYEGIAASLVERAGLPATEPGHGPAGVPADAGLAVVDSYVIDDAELEQLDGHVPVLAIRDGPGAPDVSAVLCYHPHRPCEPRSRALALLGPAYAPVDPAARAARRARGWDTGLVTVGASSVARRLVEPAAHALREAGIRDVFSGMEPGGLGDRIGWADVAVSAGGATAYDLACAGVPAILLAIADNQVPIVTAFEQAGVAVAVDAREGAAGAIAAAAQRLTDPAVRGRQAEAGPALVDGLGARRVREALTTKFGR
jgi:spore coat polysaccharide biosynthesis predicted glycosyltransferase SpsG